MVGGLIGVSPGIEDDLRVAVITDQKLQLMPGKEIAEGLCLGFGKRLRSSVDLRIRVGTGAFIVEAPFVAVVSVQIDTKSAVAVIPSVFPPVAVKIDGILQAVRIEEGDNPDLAPVNEVLNG